LLIGESGWATKWEIYNVLLNSHPFCRSKGPPRWAWSVINIASKFSEISLASVSPLDARGPCSTNYHEALTQFRWRGAEDRRVGADCRGSGSRPRALSRSLAMREPDGAPFLSPFLSLSLSPAFILLHFLFLPPSSPFSAARIYPRECAGCPYLCACIANFASGRCNFAGGFTKIRIDATKTGLSWVILLLSTRNQASNTSRNQRDRRPVTRRISVTYRICSRISYVSLTLSQRNINKIVNRSASNCLRALESNRRISYIYLE